MKKFLWLLPLCTILSACPFESTVPLEAKPVETVDSTLVGYWYGIIKDFSDAFGIEALEISQQSDSLYSIIRYGKAIKGDIILPDTAYFTGYTSYLNGQRYMNVVAEIIIEEPRRRSKEVDIRKQKVYYMATIHRSNDTLLVKTITENFSKRKYFSSPEEFKQAIINYAGDPKTLFDDQYSLSYKRINKPKPLK